MDAGHTMAFLKLGGAFGSMLYETTESMGYAWGRFRVVSIQRSKIKGKFDK